MCRLRENHSDSLFVSPVGVAIDSKDNIYVADSAENAIFKITCDGKLTILAGNGKPGSANGIQCYAMFHSPEGITVDSSGNIYVADTQNELIRKITPAGLVTTIAGSGSKGSENGEGISASFYNPEGIAVNSAGEVFVADSVNNLIRKININGVVSTVAGQAKIRGSRNGKVAIATFNHPDGIAVEKTGSILVVDRNNNLIREITTDGMVKTLAGSGKEGSRNGKRNSSSFNCPVGIAVDASNNIYVTELLNHLIRKIQLANN